MIEKREITLTINGRSHAVRVDPRRTLVDTIRDDCGQTGTHIGCEHGVCGACTVLLDGEPVRSCLMFAVQAEGRAHPHRRRPGERRRAASAAAGVHREPRPAMRLLHAGLPDAGDRRARARARTSATRTCSTCCRPISAAAPATRTSSRRCAPPPPGDGPRRQRANDHRQQQVDRPIGRAAGRPAAGPGPRPLRRRHLLSAPAPHARRALEPRAWPHRLDRHRGGARAAGRGRGLDRGRHRRRAADRFPRGPHREARALSAAGAGDRARCAMSAIRSRSCSPRIPTSRRTRPISSPWRSRSCRSLLAAEAEPGEFSPGRNTEVDDHPPGLRRRRRGVSRRARWSSSSSSRSAATPACRWRRAARSAATTPSRDMLELHGAAKVPHRNRDLLVAHARAQPVVDPRARSPCRRRLRHPRRALSGGRAGLRRRHAARPAGEMDRGPARASDRRQPFAPAAAPDPRRRSTPRAASSRSTTTSSTTRAPMCAPMRRASCT